MFCRHPHCGKPIKLIENVDGAAAWVHVEPGKSPYRECEGSTIAEPPKTIGEWLAELTQPIKKDDHG
ncbi:gp44 [Mycobacterium phage Barnyard]|uniref:Uncharacterized protein n=1 Tax=Mycobacterium phage Barnyard TaxID=205880 RepID=Q856C8_9CAUD|nr:gp44 [Mycobacterium phage Barnyard]AAN02098.1 hypothetical protein PBI_BARNYARD_44 [Mycobacterium phage Barnyard]